MAPLLYSQILKVSTCAREPRDFARTEAIRRRVIHRLAIKQHWERLLSQFSEVETPKVEKKEKSAVKPRVYKEKAARPTAVYNQYECLAHIVDEVAQDATEYVYIPTPRPKRLFPKLKRRVKSLYERPIKKVMDAVRSCILARKLRAIIVELAARRSSRKIFEMWCLDKHQYVEDFQEAVNAARLEQRTRSIIDNLERDGDGNIDEIAIRRMATELVKYAKGVYEFVPLQAQADIDPEDPQREVITKEVNTVLTSEVINTPDVTMATQEWSQLCTGDYDVVLPSATDRWLQIDSFEWKKDDMNTIKMYNLPKDIFKNCADIANLMGFRVSSLFTYDSLKLRAQISSSPFDKGLINVSAQYGMAYMKHSSDYDDQYLRTQPMHAYINAADSSAIELDLKYMYPLPAMRTRYIESNDASLHQVTVKFDVLSQLLQTLPSPVRIQVYVMFNKLRFTGMVHAAIVNLQPQMFRTLTSLLEKGLNFLDAPPNCDNPPDPTPPTYVVNTGFHSWAFGTGISEPLHALRLDARGQTPHPNMVVDIPFTVKDITSIPGYFHKFTVTKDSSLTVPVFCMDATPIPNRDVVRSRRVPGKLTQYMYPPISVVASCFSQWRGSLVITGTIVCTVKERCKLRLCYIPGVPCSVDVTPEQARVSPYAIISIPEQQSFKFVVPYITDYPWYPRRISGNYAKEEFAGPSSFRIYIENPLVPMQAVSPSFDVLLHLSAGDDFEVSVPVQPAFCLGWKNSDSAEAGLKIQTAGNYYPYYAGEWHSFLNSTAHIMRHATTSEAVTPFQSIPGYRSGYYLEIEDRSAAPKVGKTKVGEISIFYAVLWNRDDGYVYMIPTITEGSAIIMARDAMNEQTSWDDLFMQWKGRHLVLEADTYASAYSTYCVGNPKWILRHVTPLGFQSDDLLPCPLVPSTSYGNATFGENFNDLKDLCRRYQLYTQMSLSVPMTANSGRAFVKIPLYWQGMEQFEKQGYHEFRIRDSHLNLLLSGYTGMRGGLRVRIVANSSINLFVQHRPDRDMETTVSTVISEDRNADAYYNHSYASYIQTKFTDQIEIEIPYYKPFVFGYNFLPDQQRISTHTTGLGYLYIGTVHPVKESTSISLSVHTALADDAYPYVWRGFPSMCIMDDIPEIVSPLDNSVHGYELVEPQGILDWAKGKATAIADEKIAETMDDLGARITEAVNVAAQSLEIDSSHIVIPLISNVLHCIINPDIKTFALAVASLLAQLGLVTMTTLADFIKTSMHFLEQIFTKQNRTVPSPQTPIEVVDIEAQSDREVTDAEAAAGVASILYTSIATLLSFKGSPPKDMSKFKNFLIKDMGFVTRNANGLFQYIKNIFTLVQYCFHHIVGRMVPDYAILRDLEGSHEFIETWAEHALALIDPLYKRENLQAPWYRNKIDACWLEGSIIISRLTGETLSRKPLQALIKLFDQITKIREDLVAMGSHPTVRKEPFCIWVSGDRKVGKSYVSDELCIRALNRVGTQIKGNLKCVVNPMSDYWDMCTGTEPVLYIDDFFSVETDEYVGKQIQTMFSVKTSAQLIPPMAALEDKKMRYAPDIFYISSNKAFINVAGVYAPAVHRRRDMLIEAVANPKPVHDMCPHCIALKNSEPYDLSAIEPKYLADYHHILFRLARDVCDPNTTWTGPYTFMDMSEMINCRYEAFDHAETQRFRMRVDALDRVLDTQEDLSTTITEDLISKRRILLETVRKMNEGKWNDIKQYFTDTSTHWYSMWNEICKVSNKHLNPFGYMLQAQSDDDQAMQPDNWLITSINTLVFKRQMSDKFGRIFKEMIAKHPTAQMQHVKEYWTVFELACARNPIRTWFDVAVNMTSTRQDRNTCRHSALNPSSVEYCPTSNSFLMGSAVVAIDCTDSNGCVFDDPFIEELFYTTMCETQRMYKMLLRNKMYASLPAYFSQLESYRIDISGWRVIVKELIEEYFLRPLSAAARKVWQILKVTWPILATVGLVFGLTHYTYKCEKDLLQHAIDSKAEVAAGECQATRYGEPGVSRLAPKPVLPKVPVAQNSNTDAIANVVSKNIAYIRMESSKGIKHARILMIGERAAIFLRHYYEEWEKMPAGTEWCFVKRPNDPDGPKVDVLKCACKWIRHPGTHVTTSNLGVMYLPPQVPSYRCLAKYMARIEDYPSHGGEVMLLDGESRTVMRGTFDSRVQYNIPGDEIIEPVYMTQCIRYNRQARGMCGTIALSTNLNRPIMGIHVAGLTSSNHGIAEPLVYETFEKLNLKVDKEIPVNLPDVDDYVEIYADSRLIREGQLSPQMAIHQPTQTKIRPSLLYNEVFPVRTAPNPLSAYDKRLPVPMSPLTSGIMKHGQPCALFDQSQVETATAWLGSRLLTRVQPVRAVVGVVSDQVAVCGDPQLNGYECMEFKTSAGWPLSKLNKSPGKKWCFNLDKMQEGYKLLGFDTQLQTLMDLDQQKRREGIIPATMFVDCMKDTCIPIEKCSIPGKTRIFSISPVQYSVVFRKYFLDFIAAFQTARFNIYHAIGINVNSLEWTELVSRLQEKGSKIICGDYSNFGPQLSTQIVEEVIKYILQWYEVYQTDRETLEDDQIIRRSLLLELVNPYHIAKDLVYRVPTGIPSGSPITAPLNSLVNIVYLLVAWLNLVGPLTNFDEMTTCITYGDDVIMSVNDDVAELYNTVTLHDFFKDYDIAFTDADKSGHLIKYRDISTASFLKCNFRQHDTRPGKFLAALDPVSIEGTVNWVKGTGIKDIALATQVNVESACRSAFGHGPEYYNKFKNNLIRAAYNCGLSLSVPCWEELDSLWFSAALFL